MEYIDLKDVLEEGQELKNDILKKRLIEREILGKILPIERNILLVGLRGVGKTTILSQISEKVENSLLVPIDYMMNYFRAGISEFIKSYKKYIGKRNVLFLFDEVHYDPNFSLGLKVISDYEKWCKFVATGSNSILLSTSPDLARRVKIVRILPFSFSEFLLLKGYLKEKEIESGRDIVKDLLAGIEPEKYFRIKERYLIEYLMYGGFPEAAIEEDEKKIIEIIEKMILKDILPLRKVSEIEIKNILMYLSSAYEISEKPPIQLKRKEYYKLLDTLEDAGLIFPVHPFEISVKKILRKGVKYYFYPSSIPFSILSEVRRKADFGKLLENEVAVVLKEVFGEVYYPKICDFYSKEKLFEVKWGKKIGRVKYIIGDFDPKISDRIYIPKDLFLLLR